MHRKKKARNTIQNEGKNKKQPLNALESLVHEYILRRSIENFQLDQIKREEKGNSTSENN